MNELVDLMEIFYVILSLKGISIGEFEHIRSQEREERGGFEKGIFLVSVAD